jgi:hypothetical protein
MRGYMARRSYSPETWYSERNLAKIFQGVKTPEVANGRSESSSVDR